MRAAIYARCAVSVQGQPNPSLVKQIDRCRRSADLRGWTVVNDYVRSDSGASGATLASTDQLNSLIAAARKSPSPFDCIVIDKISRLGRDFIDVLRINDILKRRGVFLWFVKEKLDSRDRGFHLGVVMNGMMNDLYTEAHADKVRRGQKRRALERIVQDRGSLRRSVDETKA